MPRVQKGISWWGLSSMAGTVGYCSLLVYGHLGNPSQGEALYNISLISWSSFLFIGSCLWLRKKVYQKIILLINVVATALVIYYSFIQPDFLPAALTTAVTVGTFLLSTAWLFYKSKTTKDKADWLVISVLFICGIHALDYPILRPIESLAMAGIILCIVSTLFINLALASIVIIQFKRRMFRSEKTAIRKAMQDPLTGLNNRLSLFEEFEKRVNSNTNEAIALIYADLDDFKQINDIFGHDDGDQVLCTIASRIQNNIHNRDLAVRMGGDEFVILLIGKNIHDLSQIHQLIERLTENICKPIQINQTSHQVGVSCGIAIYPDDGNNLQSLLNTADSSMYLNKKMKKAIKRENESLNGPIPFESKRA
ncbi:GGDEF domain-containing protein [Leucothrix arctica]|nr:GGDEF domain-containing protein [Leucothrix arctica]